MHSLLMSPCLHDLIVTSLVVTWFLDSELSNCLINASISQEGGIQIFLVRALKI